MKDSMGVLFQVKVPIGVAMDLKERLEVLVAGHAQLIKKLEKNPGNGQRLKRMTQAAGRLTMTNIVRAALIHGVGAVCSMRDESLIETLLILGTPRGRPSTKSAA